MRFWLCLTLVLFTVSGTAAQEFRSEELQQLREAATKESAGDLGGAEAMLRAILEKNPTSLSAVLSLDRVLRMQGRVEQSVPFIEKLLAADPESPIGHQMLVRAYSSLDRLDDLRRAAEAWIEATPKIETPYREIARVWQDRNDHARAVQVLDLGRGRIGRDDALAIELGDAHAALQEYPRAAREYDRAIGKDGHGFMLVQRRVVSMRDGGAEILPRLIDALVKQPTTLARRKAAAQLAIDAGLSERAQAIAVDAAAALKGRERERFIVEMARKAEGARLPRVAYWAYSQMLQASTSAEQQLTLRGRLAELALAMGDTARAAASYRELEASYDAGSPQRRQALALRIQLTAREGKVDEAVREYDAFRVEFPDASELDAIASTIATVLLDRGDLDRAGQIVERVTGARSSLVRGRIGLRRGDVGRAKLELMQSAPALHGAEATEAIKLANLLGRVSHVGGDLLARATASASAGNTAEAFGLLFSGARELPGNEPAAILQYAAELADRHDMDEEAERARRVIVTEYALTPEAPAALLALGRALGLRNELDEARSFLEKLVLDHPRSALLPQARQELDRLQGRIPRS